MLYVFHGSNTSSSVTKAQALIASLRAKRPDATFISIEADTWSQAAIQENLGGQGLFSNKYIVFLNRVTENSSAKEEIADLIPLMQESTNIFIALEGKLNAELTKAFEKSAEKVVVTDAVEKSSTNLPAGRQGKEFSIFALGDALGSRDLFKTWKLYREAVDAGFEPENIIGTLFWQMKAIILAGRSATAGEAGISPFVFNNSKRFSKNYSPEELDSLFSNLITLYHDGHRGMVDLELGVERMVLGI